MQRIVQEIDRWVACFSNSNWMRNENWAIKIFLWQNWPLNIQGKINKMIHVCIVTRFFMSFRVKQNILIFPWYLLLTHWTFSYLRTYITIFPTDCFTYIEAFRCNTFSTINDWQVYCLESVFPAIRRDINIPIWQI
jgi:hypothetical protein